MTERVYEFIPKKNIKPYEIAFILMECSGVSLKRVVIRDDQWKEIPKSVQRHFKLKDKWPS